MIYEKYKSKIMAVMRVLNVIKRFRYLILAVTLTITSVVMGLLAGHGTVYKEKILPQTIEYGETFTPSAKAFMSSVVFEYSEKDGEEWSEDFPVMPGEYQVRAVSKATFGGQRYGDVHTFSIVPKSVTVSALEAMIPYGGTPTATAELVEGDVLLCPDFTFYGSATALESFMEVEPMLTTAKVVNANGEDVTACYSLKPERKLVGLTARSVTLDVADIAHVYDGEAFTTDEISVTDGTLAKGDYVEATFNGASVTNVGDEAEVEITSYTIYNTAGLDVTRYYNVSTASGLLSVSQRPIDVETRSREKTYDGLPLVSLIDDVITGEGQLLDGHKIEIVEAAAITRAGETDNAPVLCIVNEAGEDISANYAIPTADEMTKGTLTVYKRDMAITTAGNENNVHTYDGTAVHIPVIEGDALVYQSSAVYDSFDVEAMGFPSRINATSEEGIENTYQTLYIVNQDGEDVTDCYNIVEENFGLIIVNKRVVRITSGSDSKTYDGKQFDYKVATVENIVDGEELALIWDETERIKVKKDNNGDVIGYENAFEVDPLAAVNQNYITVEITFGTLRINPREVSVSTTLLEKVYDGTPLVNSEGIYTIDSGSFADTDTVTFAFSGSQTNAYNDEENPESDAYGWCENYFEVATLINREIKSGDNSVVDCYDITYTYDILKVTKRPITITSATDTKTYDGKPLTNNNVSYSGNIIQKDIENGDAQFGIIFLAESTITLYAENGVKNVFNVDTTALSANYEITKEFGTLSISKRAIAVSTPDLTKMYDGTPLVNSEESYTLGENESFADTDTPTFSFTGSQTNAYNTRQDDEYGQSENAFDLIINHEVYGDVTFCYEITDDAGTLTVTKRPIRITTSGKTFVYDGTKHSTAADAYTLSKNEDNGSYRGDPIVDTDGYSITVTGTKQNVAGIGHNSYNIVINGQSLFVASSGERLFYNYHIDSELGNLIVEKRTIYINNTHTLTFKYADIEYYDNSQYTDSDLTEIHTEQINYYLLADNQTLWVNSEKCPKYINVLRDNDGNVIAYDNLLGSEHFQVLDRENNDVTENYEIILTQDLSAYGTITIEPIYLKISQTHSCEWLYDSNIHYDGDGMDKNRHYCVYNSSSLASTSEDMVSWHTLSWEHVTELQDVLRNNNGDVLSTDNVVNFFVLKNGVDVSSNYDIEVLEWGELKILPRELTVIASSEEVIYNGEAQAPVAGAAVDTSKGDGLLSIHKINVTTAIYNAYNEEIDGIINTWDVAIHKIKTYQIVVSGATHIDVTNNYNVTCIENEFTITPRPITLTATAVQAYYDGEALEAPEKFFSISSEYNPALVQQQTLTADTNWDSNFINVGEYEHTIDESSIQVWLDGTDTFDGHFRKDNYSIRCVTKAVKILPRPILVITCVPEDKVYDGEALVKPSPMFEVQSRLSGEPALVLDHVLTVDTNWSYNWRNVGKYEHIADKTSVEIKDALGNNVNTSNYDIKFSSLTVEIIPREIIVTTVVPEGKVYDGIALEKPDEFFVISSPYDNFDLVPGHTFTADTNWSSPYVEWVNAYGYTHYVLEESAWITDENGESSYDGKFFIENYNITYVSQHVTIEKRDVILTVNVPDNKIYDGVALVAPEGLFEISSPHGAPFVLGHTLSATTNWSNDWINAGTYTHSVDKTSIEIKDTNGSLYVADGTLDGTLIANNYNVQCFGEDVTIYRRTILYQTGNVIAEYDGQPHFGEVEILEYNTSNHTGVLPGHSLSYESTTLVDVGKEDNLITEWMVEEYGVDVSSNYELQLSAACGYVQVTYRILLVETLSASKPYDGQPLVYREYVLTGEPVVSDNVDIFVTGETVEETVPNTFNISVKDETLNVEKDGTYYIGNYQIEATLGTLEITEPEEPEEPEEPDNPDEPPTEEFLVFYVETTHNGIVYLREYSNGIYIPENNSWSAANVYTGASVNPLYWVGQYLRDNNYSAGQLKVIVPEENTGLVKYMLPYYVPSSYVTDTNDVQLSMTVGGGYEISYYAYDDWDIALEGSNAALEEAYRTYVYSDESGYLSFADSSAAMRDYLDGIIADHGWNKISNKQTLIKEVAAYMQIAAVYNLNYDRAMTEEEDPLLAFLSVYKEGVCEHYAGAATLLYRQLGIPARYTVGYAVDAVAGEKTEVTNMMRHAWVEVYIHGMGWVNVEVTGGGSNPDGNSPANKLGTLHIKPVDVKEVYKAGETLTHDGVSVEDVDGYIALETMKNLGYDWEATVEAEPLTSPGVGYSRITSFVLYDPDGKDVTDKYSIDMQEGKLVYSLGKIYIDLEYKEKYYDGKPLSYSDDAYWKVIESKCEIEDGVVPEVQFNIGDVAPLMDVGKVSDAELMKHVTVTIDGQIVSGNEELCIIEFSEEKRLRILPVEVTVEAGSASKPYDGTPLTYNYAELAFVNAALVGYTMKYTVVGVITDPGYTENEVLPGSVKIFNASNKDVTSNFWIAEYYKGILQITE